MRGVARPRSTPPSTPFGVWLDAWFKENDKVTLEAFAEDVGVSKSAVSLWISATKPVSVKPTTLRRIAKRTGADLVHLERMAYGTDADPRAGRPAESGGIFLSPEQLEALLQRAAEAAVRRVLDEQRGGDRDE